MKFRNFSLGICSLYACSMLFISGCSQSQTPSASTTPAPATSESAAPVAEAPAAPSPDAATITGKVSFQGAAPSMKTVSMSKESSCDSAHKAKPQHEETVVVNPNKTLRYVFVYVKSGANAANAAPPAPLTLDQKTCWYTPHLLGVMVGQTINVVNSDSGVLHNIHFMPKSNPPLNFGQPGPAPGATPPSRSVVFHKAEIIPVKCDVHSWMHAVVAVSDNPYFGVTDETGNFKITGLPPGSYTLTAWHEKYGTQDIQVKVGKKEKKTVNFTLK